MFNFSFTDAIYREEGAFGFDFGLLPLFGRRLQDQQSTHEYEGQTLSGSIMEAVFAGLHGRLRNLRRP